MPNTDFITPKQSIPIKKLPQKVINSYNILFEPIPINSNNYCALPEDIDFPFHFTPLKTSNVNKHTVKLPISEDEDQYPTLKYRNLYGTFSVTRNDNLQPEDETPATSYLPAEHPLFSSWLWYHLIPEFSMVELARISKVCRSWRKYVKVAIDNVVHKMTNLVKATPLVLLPMLHAIAEIKNSAHKRTMIHSIEIQISLRDYDPRRQKLFGGEIVLPHPARQNMNLVLIGDEFLEYGLLHPEVSVITYATAHQIGRQRKYWAKYAKNADFVLCTESFLKRVPRVFGPVWNKYRKFPLMVPQRVDVTDYLEKIMVPRLLHTVRCKATKYTALNYKIGYHTQPTITLVENTISFLTKLAILIKTAAQGWSNIDQVIIKGTMTPSFMIYPPKGPFFDKVWSSGVRTKGSRKFISRLFVPRDQSQIRNRSGRHSKHTHGRRLRENGKGNRSKTRRLLSCNDKKKLV